MTPLQKEIEELEKTINNLPLRVGETSKEVVIDAFSQSLLRFVRSVVEEAMPEEKKPINEKALKEAVKDNKGNIIDEKIARASIENKINGFNTCRIQFKENLERILTDNTK